jgi:hypothetical protein
MAVIMLLPSFARANDDADCAALIVSAAFVSAQRHSVRANPESEQFASAPALALHIANWASKMATVFKALGKLARTPLGRSAFSDAQASMSNFAAEPVEGPRADPDRSCAAAPNRAPRLVHRQLEGLLGLERQLRTAWERACRPGSETLPTLQ